MQSGSGKNRDWADDGRVIADMDVDGMPQTVFSAIRRRRAVRRLDAEAVRARANQGETLTRRELRRYTFSAVLGGLAAGAVMAGGLLLFILLWLR